MLFQTISDTKYAGVYVNGQVYTEAPQGLTGTWRFSPHFDIEGVEYGYLYCAGCTLDDACPPEICSDWEDARDKIKAHLLACKEAQINTSVIPLTELIPQGLLFRFYELKNQITEHVLTTYPKPKNYDFLLDLERMLHSIRGKKINFILDDVKPYLTSTHSRLMYKKMSDISKVINYDPFKVKTGRLTTKRGSFPILTMSKDFRHGIKPNNDFFVELDFNAAELRTLLALSGKEQPQGDLHDWNVENVYKGMITREEAKKRIFAWLYNPNSTDKLSGGVYDRDKVLQEAYREGQVTTFFHRTIPADDHRALNYTIQSTASDLFLRQAIKIDKLLKDKKSYVAFTLHDSLVIDCAEEDRHLIDELVGVFCDTDLGKFVVNISAGNSYGDMVRVEI